MLITIDVPIPDGYEATGEFRDPKPGELRIGKYGNICTSECVDGRRIILRKSFVWPEWVKDGMWYTRDYDGEERLHLDEPRLISVHRWSSADDDLTLCSIRKWAKFPEVPPCDWKQSKRQKPMKQV